MVYIKHCSRCGKEFHSKYRNKKYCSGECSWRFIYEKNPKRQYHPCPVCGKLIANRAKACMEHTIRNYARGERHPSWKGGKWKTEAGYIRIGGRDKKRLEHTVVWEQANGKPLPKDWLIHHLNGIRDDNRIENLVAMPRKNHEHNTFIKSLQKRIKELEQLHLF